MRILDQDRDKSVNRITLYLLRSEAEELKDSLESLLRPEGGHHEHVSSSDYSKEVTVTVYDADNVSSFDGRSRELIDEDR